MVSPVAQVPPFAIENEVIPPLPEEGLAALYLKGQEATDRSFPVGYLEMGVDPPVRDSLLPKNPLQLPDKNTLYGAYTIR